MTLIEITERGTGDKLFLTHTTDRDGKEHVLQVLKPKPAAGLYAGDLLATYVLDGRAARELKDNL